MEDERVLKKFLPSSLKKLGLIRIATCSMAVCAGLSLSPYQDKVAQAGDPRLTQTDDSIDTRARLSYLGSPLANRSGSEGSKVQQVIPPLEKVALTITSNGARVSEMPQFSTTFAGRYAALGPKNEFVFYTLDPKLQKSVKEIAQRAAAHHVAIVAIDPKTGQILAMAGKSKNLADAVIHSGYPAASLFKVITAAAAIDTRRVDADSVVAFRGGDYTLTPYNYLPKSKSDNRRMTVGEAMGKSCNPVFGRLALSLGNPAILSRYARSFGFNARITDSFSLPVSYASIPGDGYELSRTGAGFGNVTLSPIHAAAIMSGLATNGVLKAPYFIDKIVSPAGKIVQRNSADVVGRMVSEGTADKLLDMMEFTTTKGTSRKEFMVQNRSVFPGIGIPGKTGTLRGKNPNGLTTWFIAAAPRNNPKIAIAVVAVEPQSRAAKASHLGRKVMDSVL